MSGKAPPRGPRALLNSLPSQASSSKLPSTSSLPAGPKANVAPPTGPRSLMNGGGALGSRFAALNGGHNHKAPPLVNGHALSRVPPSGPKGKSVDIPSPSSLPSPGTAAASSSTWVNGKRPPTGPSALRASGASKQHPARPPSPPDREPSHPSPPPPPTPLGRAPTIPPPPPASPPPIPPPPSDVPHLSAPIKLPTTQPQEPRLIPPPLPPPPSTPQPPSLAPPPLPPPVPPAHFVPNAPISFRLDPRNGRPLTQAFAPKSSVLSPPPPPPPPPPSLPPPPPPSPKVSPPSPKISPPRPPSPPLPPHVTASFSYVNGKRTKLYSLKPPPTYPPARAAFPEGRDFKVLYDGLCDKDRITFSSGESLSAKSLIETLRSRGATDRIKEVNKGKAHVIYRYHGESADGEPRPVPTDPRKASGSKRLTRIREEFHNLAYEVCGQWFHSLIHGMMLTISSLFCSVSDILYSKLSTTKIRLAHHRLRMS